MKESDAETKFRIVLQHFDLDKQVKEIDFCENKLGGALGAVESVVEYRILLDKVLLTDPEELETDWTARMADFPDSVVPCVSKHDRVFLVFLHELGHIVHGHCLQYSPAEDSPETQKLEEEAWEYAWTVYRAYIAGQRHEQEQ